MIQLKNGRFIIATKPDRRDPKNFRIVLAADADMSQYVIWLQRLSDHETFEGDYFDARVWYSRTGEIDDSGYLAFLDAVAAFRER